MSAAGPLNPKRLIQRLARLWRPATVEQLALHGSLWSAGSYIFSQGIRLGSHLILARLLYPEAFGTVGLIWIIVTGLRNLSDFGAGPNIIQSKREDEVFLNTVWTFQAGRGIIAWLVMWLTAGTFAQVYQAPLIGELLPIAALSVVIDGLTSTKLYTQNRQLLLGGLARLEIIEQILSSLLIVAWVAWKPDLSALIIGPIVARFISMLMGHLLLAGSPNRVHWDWAAFKEMMGFGKWMFAVTLFAYLAVGIDQLMLPRLIDGATYGLYAIASSFAALPMIIGSRLTNQVLLPAISRYRREQSVRALRWKIIEARRTFLGLGLIMVLCLNLFSVAFFSLLYDARYGSAGGLAQWLSVFIWAIFLQNSVDRILLALGNSRATAIGLVVQVITMVALALAGLVRFGLPGFISGLAGGTLVAAAVAQLFLRPSKLTWPLDDIFYSALLLGCLLVSQLWASLSLVLGLGLNLALVCIAGIGVLAYLRFTGQPERAPADLPNA